MTEARSSSNGVRPPLGSRAYPRLRGVLERLNEGGYDVKEVDGADEWRALCPTHPIPGQHSLYITPDSVGRAILDCDQNCVVAAIATAARLNRDDVVPPLQIEHAESVSVDESAARPRFHLLSDVDLEQLPPIEFLLDGVLPVAGLGALYGAPGTGKSFTALDMGCCVACGARWMGRTTKRGPVVYIAAEGSAGLRQRLEAWKAHQGITGVSIPIFFLTEPVNLLGLADVASLLEILAGMVEQPVLVIIDTLHRSMPGGDENSARDVGLVIEHADRLRRQTKAAVLLVHHTAKGSELERGSSSLRGAVDALLYVRNEDGRREIRSEKAKDWPDFEPIAFSLVPVGDSCVIQRPEEDETSDVSGPTGPMRQCLITLGTSFLADGASTSEWEDACGLPRSSFFRHRSDLVKQGYVAQTARGRGMRYTLTESGRYAISPKSHRTSQPSLTAVGTSSLTGPTLRRSGTDETEPSSRTRENTDETESRHS